MSARASSRSRSLARLHTTLCLALALLALTASVAFAGAPSTTASGDLGVVYGPANIHLAAVDTAGGVGGHEGVAEIWYQLNSGAPIMATLVSDDASHAHADVVVPEQSGFVTFYYWSIDASGNAETAKSTLLQMQTLQPETWVWDLYATYVDSAVLHLVAFPRGGLSISGTFYTVDGGAPVSGTTISVTGLGAHVVEYWSTDSGGNTETPRKTASFTIVHVTVPVTTSDAVAEYTDVANITLTATDSAGIAHTFWRLDDTDGSGAFTEGTSISTNVGGNHKLEFYSIDNAGIVEPVNVVTFKVNVSDNQPPVVTSDAVANYTVDPAVINLHVTDETGIAKLTYVVDGGTPVEVVPPAAVSAAAGGKAGPPIPPYAVSGPLIVAGHTGGPDPGNDALCVACHNIYDPVAGVTAAQIAAGADDAINAIGKGAELLPHATANACPACHPIVAPSQPKVFDQAVSVSGDGAHTLEFWAEDVKGNVSSHTTANFTISTTPPFQNTSMTIAISRTTAWYGRYGAPILSGAVTPSPDMVGQIMHANVKKPNRATWTYSSNRVIYDNAGQASWWYRYVFISGMPRGTYYFRGFFDGTSSFGPSSTGVVSCRL